MAVQAPNKRELFTPVQMGLWRAVWVDVHYAWDVPGEWEGQSTLKDYVHMAWEFDPDQVGKTSVMETERPFWAAQRFAISGNRYDEAGKQIMRNEYAGNVLRNPSKKIPVKVDANGEPEIYIGQRHTIYKCLLGYGGEDFKEAYLTGTLSLESLVGKQCKVFIKHGEPDKNGQVWPRVTDLATPDKGQALKPSGHYVRIKDRKDEDAGEDQPFKR